MSVRRKHRFLEIAAMAAILAAFCAACDDNPEENDPNDPANLRLAKISGDAQTERVGATLADRLTVRVQDVLANPKRGIAVQFRTADPGASVSPSAVTTGADGIAACELTLGTTAGEYDVTAAIQSDSVVFHAEAVPLGCPEETPAHALVWPAGRIYISTTSSSLLSGSGSVVIEYNPADDGIVKVLETTETIVDVAFSPRGELFCSTAGAVFKVNSSPPHALESYVDYAGDYPVEIDPNEGGVLAAVGLHGAAAVSCPPSGFTMLFPDVFGDLHVENLVADPATRDLFIVNETAAGQFTLWRIPWDGRSAPSAYEPHAALVVGTTAAPRGMCVDTTGTIYVTFDGNDNWRRIVSVSPAGSVNASFFDFYARAGGNSAAAGRWGDIACLKGNLYLIDRRNDRLTVISREGEWVKAVGNTAFSAAFIESERYGIAASPF